MNYAQTIPAEVTVILTERSRETLAHLCESKNLTPGAAASIIVNATCRLLEETPREKGADLATEVDFARAFIRQILRRLDQALGVAEKILLDSQALHRGLRNRPFGAPAEPHPKSLTTPTPILFVPTSHPLPTPSRPSLPTPVRPPDPSHHQTPSGP